MELSKMLANCKMYGGSAFSSAYFRNVTFCVQCQMPACHLWRRLFGHVDLVHTILLDDGVLAFSDPQAEIAGELITWKKRFILRRQRLVTSPLRRLSESHYAGRPIGTRGWRKGRL